MGAPKTRKTKCDTFKLVSHLNYRPMTRRFADRNATMAEGAARLRAYLDRVRVAVVEET